SWDARKTVQRPVGSAQKTLVLNNCVPVVFQACYSVAMRYEVVRSVEDKSVHMLFHEGTFDDLPARIKRMGPWQGLTGGEIEQLKPHYRLQLAEQGFAVIYQHLRDFSATT